jgi:hypothetical protein
LIRAADGNDAAMMRATAIGALATAAGLVAPAGAEASTAFRGKTEQGRLASVVTEPDGTPKRARIAWRAKCDTGAHYSSVTRFVPPYDTIAPGSFEDTGVLRSDLGKGVRARLRLYNRGSLRADGTWKGVFRVTVVVRRDGTRIDTCRLRGNTWTARPVN